MSYTSITFICFLLVTGIAYFLVPRRVQWECSWLHRWDFTSCHAVPGHSF